MLLAFAGSVWADSALQAFTLSMSAGSLMPRMATVAGPEYYDHALVQRTDDSAQVRMFDPALGTLNSVTVSMQGSVNFTAAALEMTSIVPRCFLLPGGPVPVPSPCPLGDAPGLRLSSGMGEPSLHFVDGLTGNLFSQAFSGFNVACVRRSSFSCDSLPATRVIPISFLTTLTDGTVDRYVGDGSFDAFAIQGGQVVRLLTGLPVQGAASVAYVARVDSSLQLTYTYDYTPFATPTIPVPEPATIGMMLAGLAGVSALARRRLRQARRRACAPPPTGWSGLRRTSRPVPAS